MFQLILGKRGKICLSFLILVLTLLLLFLPFLSSLFSFEKSYLIGEDVKFDLRSYGNYTLKIITPTQILIKEGYNDMFTFKLKEAGSYEIILKTENISETFNFEVFDKPEILEINLNSSNKDNFSLNDLGIIEESKKLSEDYPGVVIGKPVLWTKKMDLSNAKKIRVKIPELSEGIMVLENNQSIEFVESNLIFGNILNSLSGKENEKEIILTDIHGKIEIKYNTPAPQKIEKDISFTEKEVIVSSEIHYENVLAYTNINEIFTLDEKDLIKIYWMEGEKYIDFEAYDTDNDDFLDYVEWIAPHLSAQTFEIILVTKAEHLDSQRNFIKEVYDLIKDIDENFVLISNQEFLRVTFENNLTNQNDITIYAKGNGHVEVYEKDSNVKIADFGEINEYKKYQIFLNFLTGKQNTFDLRVIGEVEFDYVIDPTALGVCTAIEVCLDNGASGSCACSDVASSNNVYLGGGLDTKSGNLAKGVIDLTNTSLIPVGATILGANLYVEYYVESGMSYCEISYSANGGTWTFLNSNCVGNTTESSIIYDLSGLTEEELENFKINFTAVKIPTSGSPIKLFVDYAYLNISYQVAGALSLNLNAPSNLQVLNNFTVNFSYTPLSTDNFLNCSLWDNSSGSFIVNQSNSTLITNGSINLFSNTYSSEGSYIWNVECCDNTNGCVFAFVNRTFILDSTSPFVTSVFPENNSFSNSTFGIDFIFNVSDTNNVGNCSLFIDNISVLTDTTISKGINQTISYPVSDGLHNWSIHCFDEAGNENASETRNLNISFSPQTYDRRWYETFSSNFSSTANIYLENTRDNDENNITYAIPAGGLYTIVEAVSPFMVNNGALIPSGTISFSAVASASANNKAYLTWKFYITNASGDFLMCQHGDDSTGGTRITSGTGTWTGSCNNLNDLYLFSTDRIKLVLNVRNTDTGAVTIIHYWDNLRLSFVEFPDFISLGNLNVNLVTPTNDQNILTAQDLNVTCNASCDAGKCLDTNVYVQYNTSATGWTNIGASGNLILSGSETNPHNLGNTTTNVSSTNFTIRGNIESINNIRCVAISDYSNVNGTTTKQVTITGANQAPSVSLVTAENYWFNSSSVLLEYNAGDDNGQFDNCSLYLNGLFNQTNSTPIINGSINNFTLTLGNNNYNWTVVCYDSAGLNGTDTTQNFSVDTVFPQLNLTYPSDEEIIYTTNINFNFSANDNLDSVLVCNLTVDGIVKDLNFNANNGTFTNRTVSLGMGDHLWNVSCIDNAKNLNTSATWNFTIVDYPPTVSLELFDPTWFNISNPILYYNATDNNDLINCSLYINGIYNQSNSTVILNSQINNFTLSSWDDGQYNWTVNCTDTGGLSTKPANKTFYIDTTFPILNLSKPDNTSQFLISDINFNFTIIDNLDSVLVCNLTIDGIVKDLNFNANNGTLTNRLISSLTDGVKYWNVTCIDQANNTNTSATRMINVSKSPIVILNTQNNAFFNTTNVELFYTPSDNTNLSSCSLYLNGAYNQSNSTTILNGAQNNFTLTLGSGYHNWSIRCNDTIGLVNQTSYRNFTVDLAKPIINLDYPSPGAMVYDSIVSFNYTAIDDLDLNIGCNLTIDGTVQNFTTAINGSNTIVPFTFSLGGLKFWNVTCIDDSGNLNSSETRNFTLYLPPIVNLTSPENYYWANSTSLTFYYNISDGNDDMVNSSLILNGVLNQSNSTSLINNEINNFTVFGLDDGFYNWTVNVSDSESLVGTDNIQFFYVDTIKPTIIINSPYQDEVITTNNVTLNFTLIDNLAENITCNVSVDDFDEFQNEVFINDTNIRELLRNDGNYTWYVECIDMAKNYNITSLINFSVVAPPIVNLTSPSNNWIATNSTVIFRYIPYDAIGITQCKLYFDEGLNQTDNTINKNEENSFAPVGGISEGEHNWTVECSDADLNLANATLYYFTRDISPPTIGLELPINNSGKYFDGGSVTFRWTANDSVYNIFQCDLIVDGIVKKNDEWVTSGISNPESVAGLTLGWHNWNVTCWDALNNSNNSLTYGFNFTYPDFFLNQSTFSFNVTNPKEGESVFINLTLENLGGTDINNVVLKFYDGNPDLGGSQIGADKLINISKYNLTEVNTTYIADVGTSEIFVLVDPPFATNGTYDEWNESNNEVSGNITVGSWHFFYGEIDSSSNYSLMDSSEGHVINWNIINFSQGEVFISDLESDISWLDLVAIGKKINLDNSTDDFIEIDSLLNMSNFEDSVNSLYSNDSIINLSIFGKDVNYIPIANSTNNTNFITGILWDSLDDIGDLEFDEIDKEDLIFVTKINQGGVGAYGIYDYEIRVPAMLREYDSTNSESAVFYAELL
ncbi:MAG TPA: hypothetical protein VJB35_06195 [Candidatus Nanoarchaeia archaeon]|nr:hypothetical protein [Candidatus Nanoarchaeia archaeon]